MSLFKSGMQEQNLKPGCKHSGTDDETRTTLIYKARKKFALLRILNESKEHSNPYHPVLLDIDRGPHSRSSITSRQQGLNFEEKQEENKNKLSGQGDGNGGGQALNTGPNLPRCVILHYSPFKAIWDWITLILVLYIALATPYFAAFHSTNSINPMTSSDISQSNTEPSSFEYSTNSSFTPSYTIVADVKPSRASKRGSINVLVIVDLVVDIMFIADILINFRTTYLCDGEVVTEPGKIAINYIKGWFFIDALAAIPFDLLLFRVPTDRVTLTGVLKAARLLRLLRVARRIDQYSEYGAAVLLLLMGTFVLISHWLACIFYAIAYYERLMPDALPIGWLDGLANKTGMPYLVNDSQSGPDTGTSYITSLYFTFTILTGVGFGNVAAVTNSEKVFTIIAMLVGSLLSAAIFGNVSSIMLRLYQGTEEYLEMQTRIKEFIRFHHIPKPLADRLVESFQHSRSFAHGIDMNSVLKGFPECLQADICLHLNRILLNNCEAFSGATQGCLRALSVKFKSTHCPPGDTLVHPGDIIDAIFFIARGTIEVVADDVIMAILGKGDIIGDDSVFSSDSPPVFLNKKMMKVTKSSYSVRAISYCDLHTISVSELKSILEVYPEFAGKFVQNFRVTFNLRKGDPLYRSCAIDNSTKRLIKQERPKVMTKVNEGQLHLTPRERIASMRRAFSTKGKSAGIDHSIKDQADGCASSRNSIVVLSPHRASAQPTEEDFRPFHISPSLVCTSSSNKSKSSSKKTPSASDIVSWTHQQHLSTLIKPQVNREISVSLTAHYVNGTVQHTPNSPSSPQTAPVGASNHSAFSRTSNSFCQTTKYDVTKSESITRKEEHSENNLSVNQTSTQKSTNEKDLVTNYFPNVGSGSKSFDDHMTSKNLQENKHFESFLTIEVASKIKSASCGEPRALIHDSVQPQFVGDKCHMISRPFSGFVENSSSCEIPQPLKNINDRLREINKRMWAFEKNLFSAVDNILEMLESNQQMWVTAQQPTTQHSPTSHSVDVK